MTNGWQFAAAAIGTLVVVGCQTNFVLLRDVPPNPTFTVLPANDYLAEVEFARQVESALVAAGVSVLSPPPTIDVTQEMTLSADDAAGGKGALEGKSAEAKQVLRFRSYDNLHSTYVVNTIARSRSSGQIRIELRETREVLVVFHTLDSIRDKIKKAVDTLLTDAPGRGVSM